MPEYEVDWTARADATGKPDPLDCSLESHPRCPYCGHVDTDTCDLWSDGFSHDDDVTESECGNCEREYRIVLSVRYSYSTEPVEPSQ
jgi:transcription elongation factor Elf1